MNEVQTTKNTATATTKEEAPALVPPVDVVEDATGLTLYIDLPGVPKDKIDLKVEGDMLTIGGEVVAASPEGMEPVYAVVQLGRYRRAFTLSRELDAARVEASSRDGSLRLRIPKTEAAQPRRIPIQG
jgi:HSP20 family molecular chaperone IbpA